jgi:hypothetical protein
VSSNLSAVAEIVSYMVGVPWLPAARHNTRNEIRQLFNKKIKKSKIVKVQMILIFQNFVKYKISKCDLNLT